jgi:hypothetical protein
MATRNKIAHIVMGDGGNTVVTNALLLAKSNLASNTSLIDGNLIPEIEWVWLAIKVGFQGMDRTSV